ncbi:MarR family transcriptional regulator [Gordonia oryzae]|uniref:MarR family transcriptional regulator n=1 Tax=Gordonia oryzae TaxID=2487349 RepID=A0A3N4GG77_9ACTN|nr:MarR family transcriptional regulator [Gordonia oryzae]RPA61175.1 MarR family transcriptional regulator [Gordonia oryzae]
MDHPKLTPSQSAVLFVLMSEGKELSTPQLRVLGPNLDKPGREVLQRHGLIESHKGARGALFHSLTDRGWAWCATELQDGPPDRSLPPIRALYAVLAGIGRYLDAEDLRLHEVFGRPRRDDEATPEPPPHRSAPEVPESTADVGTRIIEAYHRIAAIPGALVGLAALRATLASISREDFDAALLTLQERRGINVIPQDDRARLTEADRAASVMIGTQPSHLLVIEEA